MPIVLGVCVGVLTLCTGPVCAQGPRQPISVRETDTAAPSTAFLEALRIQARGRPVQVGALLPGRTHAKLLESARRACAAEPPAVLVWLLMAEGQAGTPMLHVYDCAHGRAVSEVLEASTEGGPAEQRALSLKALSLVNLVEQAPSEAPVHAEASAQMEEAALESAPALDLAGALMVSALPPLHRAAWAELGLSAALGARLDFGREAIIIGGLLRVEPGQTTESDGQRLTTASVAPGLALTGLLQPSAWVISVESAFYVRRLAADASTALGSAGSLSTWVPELELTAGLGYQVITGLALEARAGALCHLARRRLAVGGVQLGDTGTCGAVLSLGLRH